MCNIDVKEYVNPAHKMYCEFLKLVQLALPGHNAELFTIEELIDMGIKTKYGIVFEEFQKVCKNISFTYTDDFVLMHYKPTWVLYEDVKDSEGIEKVWNDREGLLRYCRGIVFHRRSGVLVINPYAKFFNIGEIEECTAVNIVNRWEHGTCTEVSEKVDGSMINARYFNGKVVVSSSTQLEGNKCPQLKEAEELMKDYAGLLKTYPNITFIFELVSPNDRHIVYYKGGAKLILIGMKSTHSEHTFAYKRLLEVADEWNIPATEVYGITLKDVLRSRDEKKAEEAEGFVVNIDGYRAKIKYNDYLKACRSQEGLGPNGIVKAVADGNIEELELAYNFKEGYVREIVQNVGRYVKAYGEEIEKAYQSVLDETGGNKEKFMRVLQDKVRQDLRKHLIMKYYGKFDEGCLLKNNNGRYVKYNEILEYFKTVEDGE